MKKDWQFYPTFTTISSFTPLQSLKDETHDIKQLVYGPCSFLTQQLDDLFLKSVVLFRAMHQLSYINEHVKFFIENIGLFKQFSVIFALRGMGIYIYSLEAFGRVCARYNSHGPYPITEHILETRFSICYPDSIKFNTGSFKDRLFSAGERLDRLFSGYLRCDFVSQLNYLKIQEIFHQYFLIFNRTDEAREVLDRAYVILIHQLLESPQYFPVDLPFLILSCIVSFCKKQWLAQFFLEHTAPFGKDCYDFLMKAQNFGAKLI